MYAAGKWVPGFLFCAAAKWLILADYGLNMLTEPTISAGRRCVKYTGWPLLKRLEETAQDACISASVCERLWTLWHGGVA